ncbi:MAG: ribose-5-phosphate isomerase RpiA [Candidatus Schekmanbacteria bacterium]|nr:ribose-5-phosphate isomerase RpiA [Candidatus Schekmanbacteria bacterium]
MKEACKRAAAALGVTFVKDGDRVGLGTGSTAQYLIELLGQKVAQGLTVSCVASSEATRALAEEAGLDVGDLPADGRLDITLDGADEVDPELNLIKGGGGALLREKVLAAASDRVVIMVDSAKRVSRLGESFPVPIEVLPFAVSFVRKRLQEVSPQAALRLVAGAPFVTDNGNWIVDCALPTQVDVVSLAGRLAAVPGIVEHGLFVALATEVIVAEAPDRVRVMRAAH